MHVGTTRARGIAGLLVPALGALLALSGATAQAPPGADKPPEAPPLVWEEWGDAVFARARQQQRGVLLTVVTPWCSPCTSADREVYSDPIVRQLVARSWIPVRVDALDRPDLDSRYRMASWVLSQQTGYPVTGFLFPTGEAIWVEGFIPAQDRETRLGLRSLLARMDRHWKTEFEQARQNAFAVQKAFEMDARENREVALDGLLVSSLTDAVISRNDAVHGGFGAPPRRQNPFAAELVLLAARRRDDPGLERRALEALRAPVRGALFDRIGGGFHVAAVDPAWTVPVFEKMLAVNAVYLHALVEAVRASGDEELAEAARGTVDYVIESLGGGPGVLHAMQAPAAPGEEEASYYAWTVEEVKEALGPDDLPWAGALFGFDERGEVLLGLPPRFTLKSRPDASDAVARAGLDPAESARREEAIVSRLAALRAARPSPPVLDREYLDSTAMACSALLQAAPILKREDAARTALAALDRILGAHSVKEGVPHRLDRSEGSPILMVDQAYLGHALLDAHEATGEGRFLAAAVQTAKTLLDFFDAADGAFFDVVDRRDAAGYARLRRKIFLDAVQPSPQVVAARLLERIGYHAGDPTLVERAAKAYLWTVRRVPAGDLGGTTLALAVDAMLNGPVRIRVGGTGPEAMALRRTAAQIYEPSKVILASGRGRGGEPAMSLCLGEDCKDGLITRNDLESALEDLRAEARARLRRGQAHSGGPSDDVMPGM